MHDSKTCEPHKQEPIRKKKNGSFLRSYQGGIPLLTLCYVVFYILFIGEAWGRRGDVNPLWLQIERLLMFPTVLIPSPLVSAIVVGIGYGFVVVFIGRVLMEIISAVHRKAV